MGSNNKKTSNLVIWDIRSLSGDIDANNNDNDKIEAKKKDEIPGKLFISFLYH